jgi:hypothetical protein
VTGEEALTALVATLEQIRGLIPADKSGWDGDPVLRFGGRAPVDHRRQLCRRVPAGEPDRSRRRALGPVGRLPQPACKCAARRPLQRPDLDRYHHRPRNPSSPRCTASADARAIIAPYAPNGISDRAVAVKRDFAGTGRGFWGLCGNCLEFLARLSGGTRCWFVGLEVESFATS